MRTSTPSGAASVTGAKFKMLLTPAAASRSQTDWATSAGVVMTPMEACVAATTSSSSSIGRTVSPPMRCPMRAGAASNSPTNSKPREPKPA